MITVFVSESLQNKFGNSRCEAQAQKQLEKQKHETWFQDAKTRLHITEVLFLIPKTATRKCSLSVTVSQYQFLFLFFKLFDFYFLTVS